MTALNPPTADPVVQQLDAIEEAVLAAILADQANGESILLLCGPESALPWHLASKITGEICIPVRSRYEMPEPDPAYPSLRFIQARWEDVELGRFDQAVCLFSQLAIGDPFAWMRRMALTANRRIVIEAAAPRRSDVGLLPALLARLQPVLWLARPLKPGRQIRRGFLFTAAALGNFFHYQTAAFEPVEAGPLSVPGHAIATATRRRIRNLAIIAGPSSAGKSTFARRLMEDQAYRENFGFSGNWEFSRGRDLVNLRAGPIENLFAELDILAIEREEPGSYELVPQFDIVDCAENITVLTVLPDNPSTHDPMRPKERTRVIQRCGRLGVALSRYYAERADRKIVRQIYTGWFEWIGRRRPAEMKLVVNDYRNFRLADFNAFEALLPP